MKKFILSFSIGILCTRFLCAQGTWIQKANFLGVNRVGAIGFSVGNKGYIGTGHDGYIFYKDFWEWNPLTNTWTQKADFAGTAREAAIGFSIGTKGYIGTGIDNFPEKSPPHYTKDFWEWDQSTNTWNNKSDFPGGERASAAGFSIGTKGYIGTGEMYNTYVNDFWEWDQVTDSWSKKADLPASARHEAIGFSISNFGYIGTGEGNNPSSPFLQDFWEWNQLTNTWTKKANFISERAGAMGFSIGNKGYVGTGERYSQVLSCTTDFWEWDQTNDIWKKVADFGGQIRMGAIGFSIGQKGYLGLGINLGTIYNDFWEYTPSSESTGMNEIKNNIDLNIFPNPSSNKVTINFSSSVKDKLQLKITNSLGEIIYSESKKDFSGEYVNTFDLSQQPKGVYFLEAIIGEERRTRKIILQ